MQTTTGAAAAPIDPRARLKQMLKYLGLGLVVALALGRVYPGLTHCLKQQCGITFTVLNVVFFWITIVFWPLVVGGVVLGKGTCWIASLI